jgi:ATP-dependent HslUV protease, peptidase subunit HslV
MPGGNMELKGTTIVCVRREKAVAMAGDGQVTLGDTIMKGGAKKVRRVYDNNIITGFAGSVADAFTLYEKFENKLNTFNGDITRACVELSKEWRTDKYLRRLEAMLIVADKNKTFVISGNGDVIEPEDSIIAIGSGGNYARSAALALFENTDLSAREIAEKALKLAAKICIYTNDNIIVEEINE